MSKWDEQPFQKSFIDALKRPIKKLVLCKTKPAPRLNINCHGEYSLNLESPEVRADVIKQIRKFKDFPTEN